MCKHETKDVVASIFRSEYETLSDILQELHLVEASEQRKDSLSRHVLLFDALDPDRF